MNNHIFEDLCKETRKLEKTHETIGCPLSSAFACILAKATGKPVTIEKEETLPDATIRIQYTVLEDLQMQIPLDFWNVSLWLAVTAIILLITVQTASAYDGKASILVDQKKLRTTALVIGILFLATVAIGIYGIVAST
jgi:hypothetical protein